MISSHARTALVRLTAAAALVAAPLGAQTPSHVYTLTSGSLADAFGGPSLALHGTNTPGSFGGAEGFFFNAGGGFTLENALANTSVYTLELRFLFDQTDGWRKIVDFKNRTSDHGFYNYHSEARFYPYTTGGGAAFTVGQLATAVITRTGGGVVTGYVDGAQRFSFHDAGGSGIFNAANEIIHFLHDDGSENASGFVDYIRLYDQALTAQQVTALAPPGMSAVPEPATVALLATGLLAVGGVARRRRHA